MCWTSGSHAPSHESPTYFLEKLQTHCITTKSHTLLRKWGFTTENCPTCYNKVHLPYTRTLYFSSPIQPSGAALWLEDVNRFSYVMLSVQVLQHYCIRLYLRIITYCRNVAGFYVVLLQLGAKNVIPLQCAIIPLCTCKVAKIIFAGEKLFFTSSSLVMWFTSQEATLP